MTDVHGSQLKIRFNAQDISDYVMDDLELSAGTRELHDTTGYGSTDTTHVVSPIKEGVPINIGGQLSTQSHAFFAPLDGETEAVSARPAGDGAGLMELVGNATLTDYTVKTAVRGPGTWTAVLTPNDGLEWDSQA